MTRKERGKKMTEDEKIFEDFDTLTEEQQEIVIKLFGGMLYAVIRGINDGLAKVIELEKERNENINTEAIKKTS